METEHQVVVQAPVDRLFAVVTDYARYPDFLPEVQAVSVHNKGDGVALVHFDLQLIVRLTFTLRLLEDFPTQVSWSLSQGKMIEQNSGSWRLEPLGAGQSRATYALRLRLGGLIPTSVSTRLLGAELPRMLGRFADRAQSDAPAAAPRKKRVS
ncbi:MAG: hypothetical protein EOO40_09055 [Deltaproteobacteria bacterium]|nr:MAG: hypothetical protein EOO40_09055 [Deltaproteobacteria bacterium]